MAIGSGNITLGNPDDDGTPGYSRPLSCPVVLGQRWSDDFRIVGSVDVDDALSRGALLSPFRPLPWHTLGIWSLKLCDACFALRRGPRLAFGR